MDILVTIPRKEKNNIRKEDEVAAQLGDTAFQFWSMARKPKALDVGSRVYFVENGHITSYQEFLGFVYDPVCEITHRLWPGLNLLLKCPYVSLKKPVPHRGFQGFSYIERIE